MLNTVIIIISVFFSVAFFLEPDNPVKRARNAFNNLENYKVTIKTECCSSDEYIEYTFRKPGFIRMDFITPHEGAVLVYNPETQKVRLKPFGLFSFLKLTLDPDNSLILSPKGHRVDQSDFSFLLKNVDSLLSQGELQSLNDAVINGRSCDVVKISGLDGHHVDDIYMYKIWFDKTLFLPLKVEAYDSSGVLTESVLSDNVQVNIDLDKDLFNL